MNELDRLLECVTREPAYGPAFYQALLRESVYALIPEGAVFTPAGTVRFIMWTGDDGQRVIPFFSNRASVRRVLTEQTQALRLQGRIFLEACRGGIVVLNPNEKNFCRLMPGEVALLLDTGSPNASQNYFAPEPMTLELQMPDVPPDLLHSLSLLLAQFATLQGRLVCAISERWVAVGDSAVALPLYLDGIFRLQRLLRRSVGHRLRLAIYRVAGFDMEVKDSSVPFESLSVEERRSEWETIAALLDSWPTRFVSIGRAVELRWSDITEERTAHVPFWLERVGREHFDRTWYRPSAGEMVSVRTFLDTYGLSSRPTLVREWTGGWVQVRRVSIAPVPIDAPEQFRLPMIDASDYRQQVQRVWIQRLVKSLRRYCLHSLRKPSSLSRWNCTQLEFLQMRA